MMNLSTKILLSLLIILVIADVMPLGMKPIAAGNKPVSYAEVDPSGDEIKNDVVSGEGFSSGEAMVEPSGEETVVAEEPSGETNSVADASESVVQEPSNTSAEPAPTKAPEKAPEVKKTPKKLTSTATYYIKVNNRQNVVNIYTKDESGEYTIPYKAMVCSTGEATPAAGKSYKTTTYKNRWNGLVGNVYGQYITQIVGDILFHSVPYTKKDVSTLEYWEYDKLGEVASAGCVRLTVQDSKWIYDNVEAGTIVEFYEDDDPGPFGKPTAQKISDNERCRDWDPTDPAEGNPWNIPEEPSTSEELTIEELLPTEETETPPEELSIIEDNTVGDDVIIENE